LRLFVQDGAARVVASVRAPVREQAPAAQLGVDGVEELPGQPERLEQMTKVQQLRSVRHRLPAQVDTDEVAQRLAVVDGILHRLAGRPMPLLKDVHLLQNLLQTDRAAARPRVRTWEAVRRKRRKQRRPGHQLLHLGQQALAAGHLLIGRKLGLRKRQLLHGVRGQSRCVALSFTTHAPLMRLI
jgi:hypothetical protein